MPARAEGQGREGAVGAGMGVAAHQGHARQGEALLGTDDVDDALADIVHGELGETELGAVGIQGLHLGTRDRIGDALVAGDGGHVVIRRRQHRGNAPELAASHLQTLEGLRAGHFMDQVAIDVDQRRAVRLDVDDMGIPELVVKGTWHGCATD